MDYGKLAYLKAVDLEGRKFNDNKNLNIFYLTLQNNQSLELEVAEITSTGDAAVFINCSEEAVIMLGEDEVCRGNNLFFKVSGGGKIVAYTADEAARLDFMAIGDNLTAVACSAE